MQENISKAISSEISKEMLEIRKDLVLEFLEALGYSQLIYSGVCTTVCDGKSKHNWSVSGINYDCGYISVFLSDKMEFNGWWFDDFHVGLNALREYLEFKRKYKLM